VNLLDDLLHLRRFASAVKEFPKFSQRLTANSCNRRNSRSHDAGVQGVLRGDADY
jgi:hypothetical protein